MSKKIIMCIDSHYSDFDKKVHYEVYYFMKSDIGMSPDMSQAFDSIEKLVEFLKDAE